MRPSSAAARGPKLLSLGRARRCPAMRLVALIALALAALGRPVLAETVDLKLVLLADVSRSITDEEFRLQRNGYAQAMTDPRVLKAITSGPYRSIAVTFIEFAG